MSTWIQRSAMTLLLLTFNAPAVFAAAVREEAISFATHDGLEIQCILSYPDTRVGTFPGMLLIAGSGLHDADVTLEVSTLQITRGSQTIFKPLARHFSRQGWGVLRCNKRGASFGHTRDQPELLDGATLDDLVEDARVALATLYDHPRVAASPLVVLGHSEGAQIAAELAQERPEIDLVVLMGSVARSFASLIEYQLVDRNLTFFRQAADADRDGALTLEELDRLDGDFGLGSVYVLNSASVLFAATRSPTGELQVSGLHPGTDSDGDGRLHISRELEPALREETERFLQLARSGALGDYWQSLVAAPAPVEEIHRVPTRILFVHGALDVQTPIDEPLALMAALEAQGRKDYDVLLFSTLGHSLSKPNDFYLEDGGLTVLDNLTLNAPRSKARRRLLNSIDDNLPR